MPSIERERPAAGPRLTGFTAAGGFRVDGRERAAVLLTEAVAVDWTPPSIEALTEADLSSVLEPLPELILLGTGAVQAQPPPALRAALEARGVGLEAMDSRAAARLWGLLRTEGRTVAAALYPLR